MSVFNKVSPLVVSNVTLTGFTVAWSAPQGPFPATLDHYDVPLCPGAKLGSVLERAKVGDVDFFNFTSLVPGTEYTVGVRAQDTSGGHSGEWQTITVSTLAPFVGLPEVTAMLAFMRSQIGKPYKSVNPDRFGPDFYDCSGLIYAACVKAGVPLPKNLATADTETAWFAEQAGAYVVPGIPQLIAGDIVGCLGAVPNPVTVNGHVYQIGHIGIMADSTNLLSALNAARGVCLEPVSFLDPMLAIRPQG